MALARCQTAHSLARKTIIGFSHTDTIDNSHVRESYICLISKQSVSTTVHKLIIFLCACVRFCLALLLHKEVKIEPTKACYSLCSCDLMLIPFKILSLTQICTKKLLIRLLYRVSKEFRDFLHPTTFIAKE